MAEAPTASPVHSSVHTSTALNVFGGDDQRLTVVTSRLVIARRDGDLHVTFGMHKTHTMLRGDSANEQRKGCT